MGHTEDDKGFTLPTQKVDISIFTYNDTSYMLVDGCDVFFDHRGFHCPTLGMTGYACGLGFNLGLELFAGYVDNIYTMYVRNPDKVKLSATGKKIRKIIKKHVRVQ